MNRTDLGGSRTLSSRLSDHIIRQIEEEGMSPGDRLGTELELASQHDISRTVVREAIGALRGLGIVSSRQRHGIFVAEPNVGPVLSKVLSHSAIADDGWRELATLRVVVEMGAIVLAVKNASEDHIDLLHELAHEMWEMLDGAEDDSVDVSELKHAFIEKDLEFHEVLLQAADSSLALMLHSVLGDYFSKGEHALEPPTLSMAQEHLDLVDAIKKRDTNAAFTVMVSHMGAIQEVLHKKKE